MKYSSKVWTVPFLGMVLITAAVPVRGQQNQPGPSTPQQLRNRLS